MIVVINFAVQFNSPFYSVFILNQSEERRHSIGHNKQHHETSRWGRSVGHIYSVGTAARQVLFCVVFLSCVYSGSAFGR